MIIEAELNPVLSVHAPTASHWYNVLLYLLFLQACDNAMLQILGATCRNLEHLDIWKSTAVTDSGVAMLLGLEAERPFRVCSTLRKVRTKCLQGKNESKVKI